MNHGGVYKKEEDKHEEGEGRKKQAETGEMNKKALSYSLHGGHT